MSNVPCPTCPWRLSSTVGGADIPKFNMEKMRNLSCTVGDGDAFRPIMACHGSPDGGESSCIGYLNVHGWSNLSVRLQAIDGKVDLHAIKDACESIPMYDSFDDMLEAFELAQEESTDG